MTTVFPPGRAGYCQEPGAFRANAEPSGIAARFRAESRSLLARCAQRNRLTVTEVFADSFYWIALLNPADAFHEATRTIPAPGRIVTSLAVQMEVLDAFSTTPSLRPSAIHFWQCTTYDPQVTVIPLDS